MSTTTTRLGLYKPASDGSELVNVVTDLNNNYDALDLAVGFRAVTSSTRPSTPYSGQPIQETDTGRTYVHNGTAPASGGYVEIPNGASRYASQLLNESTAASGVTYGTRVVGDSQDRLQVRADGRLDWGPGSGARDVNLYRSSADLLRTDDSLSVGGDLTVTGVGRRLFAIKSGNTNNSTTTVASDPHLTLAITPGTWEIALKLWVASGDINADLLVQFLHPTGTFHYMGQGAGSTMGSGTTVGDGEWIARQNSTSGTSAAIAYGIGSASTTGVHLQGNLIASGSGNLVLQWAQFVSSGTAVTLLAGSSMTAVRSV